MSPRKYTEARKQANKRWDSQNQDKLARLSIVMDSNKRESVRQAATNAAQSVNAYINQAINERMERENNQT